MQSYAFSFARPYTLRVPQRSIPRIMFHAVARRYTLGSSENIMQRYALCVGPALRMRLSPRSLCSTMRHAFAEPETEGSIKEHDAALGFVRSPSALL